MRLATLPLPQLRRPAFDASRAAGWTGALPSAALALGLIAFVLADSSLLLGDPDSLWHVATGRWIWEHQAVPSEDVFSHTFYGAPWIAKEWLSQLLLHAAHTAAGWRGVVVLTAACICAAFVMMHEWLRRRLRPPVALVLALVAIFLGEPHFLARPHVLVLPVIVLWMGAIVGAADRGGRPPLAAALLMVVWTNMHGSFPLGLVLAALLGLEAIVLAPAARRPAVVRGWTAFLALAGAAALVSPYGWRAIVVPLTVGNAATLPFIAEWKSLGPDAFGIVAIGLLVVVAVLLLRDAKREAVRALAVALLAMMMIRHVRFISLFGLLVPFLVARVLTRWGRGRDAPTGANPAFAAALVAPLAIVVVLVVTMRPTPPTRIAPARALAFARAHDLSGPVYNTYDFGGFLVDGGIKTFVDGRTDQLFLGDFLPRVRAAIAAPDSRDFAAILAARHVTWALVRPHSQEAGKLENLPGWSRLYADDVAAVYAPARAKVPAATRR